MAHELRDSLTTRYAVFFKPTNTRGKWKHKHQTWYGNLGSPSCNSQMDKDSGRKKKATCSYSKLSAFWSFVFSKWEQVTWWHLEKTQILNSTAQTLFSQDEKSRKRCQTWKAKKKTLPHNDTILGLLPKGPSFISLQPTLEVNQPLVSTLCLVWVNINKLLTRVREQVREMIASKSSKFS